MVGGVLARLLGDVERGGELGERAVQGAEGTQHRADLGRDRQLEPGGQAEQVGEHLRGRRGTAGEVTRDEPPEGPLQLVFVKLIGAVNEIKQGITERRGVAAPDGEQQVLQRDPLLGVEVADRTEVEQREAAVGEQQDVAWMRVGMEHPALGDLVHHAAQQRSGHLGPVIGGREQVRVGVHAVGYHGGCFRDVTGFQLDLLDVPRAIGFARQPGYANARRALPGAGSYTHDGESRRWLH